MRVAVVATAICLSIVGLAGAQGAKAAIRMPTNIPAQPLGPALKAFAQERDLQVLYFSQTVRGMRTGGASGELTADEALTQLLGGTGLVYRYVDDRAVTILPAQASEGALPATSDDPNGGTAPEEGKKDSSGRFPVAHVDQGGGAEPVAAVAGNASAPGDSQKLELQEIVVTAQKREERLIDVPISIVALTATDLQERNIVSLDDLAMAVPGLSISSQGSYNRRIFLRGVSNLAGTGNTATIGMYLDEADVTTGSFTQLDVRTYDLERVEVLRGPQGTLYGDGSAGGTIRFITRNPQLDRFGMSADVASLFTQAGAPSQRIEAMLNVPLIDNQLGVRIAGTFDHEGGWIDQPAADQKDINGQNLTDVRVKALWKPTESLSINAMALIHRNDAGINYGEDSGGNFQQLFNQTTTPSAHDSYNLYNLTLTSDASAFRILGTVTYLKQDQEQRDLSTTFSGIPVQGVYIPLSVYDNKSLNGEIRISSIGSGPWQWTAGAFFRDFDFSADQPQFYFGDPTAPLPEASPVAYIPKSRSWATFGDTSYKLTDRLRLGVGVRYFSDREESELPAPQKQNFHTTSPRFYLDYSIAPDVNAYASAAKGFRSGGFNSVGAPSFGPESVWTYELGSKMSLLDGRVRSNVDVFYTNYKDYQIFGILPPPQQPLDVTTNGGTARVKGVEWDFGWRPSEGWTLSLNGTYTDAYFKRIDVTSAAYISGDPLDFFPKYVYTVSAQRDFKWNDRSGYARLDYSETGHETYRNRSLGDTYFGRSDIINMLNFNVRLQWNETLSFSVFAQNLLNDRGLVQPYSTATTFTESDVETRSRPRTFGIGFGASL